MTASEIIDILSQSPESEVKFHCLLEDASWGPMLDVHSIQRLDTAGPAGMFVFVTDRIIIEHQARKPRS